MRQFRFLTWIASMCVWLLASGLSAQANKCIFTGDRKPSDSGILINVISSLVGKKFTTEKNGYKYVVSVCSDVPNGSEYESVSRSKGKTETVVLGRRNDTHIYRGRNWLVLSYGSGDVETDKKCLVHRRASIYFVCEPEEQSSETHRIELVEEDGSNYKFILGTASVCTESDDISGGKVFIIVVSLTMAVYCLAGILYKRFVRNAQSCRQLPHFEFWSRVGAMLADGCNYVCRCEAEGDESWNAISGNLDAAGDRDDALLRP